MKVEILRVAERHALAVTLVSTGWIRPSRDPLVRHVVVSTSAEAAEDWLAETARPNDIVVTDDIPLASRMVAAGAHVLGPTGRPFTREDDAPGANVDCQCRRPAEVQSGATERASEARPER